MDLEIALFDTRASRKYGVYFGGQVETSPDNDHIGYLDFMSPNSLYKKFNNEMKAKFFNVFETAEKSNIKIYLSGIKDRGTKKLLDNSIATLFDYGDDVFSVLVRVDGQGTDDIWLSKPDPERNRYIGFGSTTK